MGGEKRNLHRRKLNAKPDLGAALGELSREQEFIVAKSAVAGLHNVLRGAQLILGIGIDASGAAGQVPNAGGLEAPHDVAGFQVGNKNLRPLVRELVIQFASEQNS